jgi:hypothetical protein
VGFQARGCGISIDDSGIVTIGQIHGDLASPFFDTIAPDLASYNLFLIRPRVRVVACTVGLTKYNIISPSLFSLSLSLG